MGGGGEGLAIQEKRTLFVEINPVEKKSVLSVEYA